MALQAEVFGRDSEVAAIRTDMTRAVLGKIPSLPGRRGEETLSEAEAWRQLEEIHSQLLRAAQRIANKFSPIRWLWYLRRLPGLFEFNSNPTTPPYCRVMAESLTRSSSRRDTERPSGSDPLTYPTTGASVRQILKLKTAVGLLYSLHSTMRWCGKGSPVLFQPSELPETEPEEDLIEAVELYDQRNAGTHSLLASAGLFADVRDFIWDPEDMTHREIPTLLELNELTMVPMFPNNVYGADYSEGRFILSLFDLGAVGVLSETALAPDVRWPMDLLLAVILLVSCFHPIFLEDGYTVAASTGYSVIVHEALAARLSFALDYLRETRLGGLLDGVALPSEPETVLSDLSTVQGGIWPPRPSSPIRAWSERATLVDVRGATDLLFDSMRRSIAGGSDVNRWADTFESQVQTIIDGSAWKPPPAIAELIGRTLRISDSPLTDIDAVGESGQTLLLVSCKSVAYTEAFDRGEYRAVRNQESHVEESLAEWDAKVESLRQNPAGDNYDLTGFQKIVGLVVYPFPPFTRSRHATREVLAGLRAVVGAAELYEWTAT